MVFKIEGKVSKTEEGCVRMKYPYKENPDNVKMDGKYMEITLKLNLDHYDCFSVSEFCDIANKCALCRDEISHTIIFSHTAEKGGELECDVCLAHMVDLIQRWAVSRDEL